MYWNVASSPRLVACAPCRSIRFPSPRTCWTQPERSATDWSSDAGASRRRTGRRRAHLWSETEKRDHLPTALESLRDQRVQIAETFNMKNTEGTE